MVPQELLEHGVCEEVERVRLSERYQTMKVRAGRTQQGLGALPRMTARFQPRTGGKPGHPGVREGLTEEVAAS